MNRTLLGITVAAAIAVSAATGLAQGQPTRPDNASPATEKDATEACTQMMQGAEVTDEGRKAMQDFMKSDRPPEAMANMKAMARRMGNGDVMFGMTRMMEMMRAEGSAAPSSREPRR
jgi:hypothetical protein